VYLYKDDKAKVLYVGKAKNLRNRVRSYWQASKPHDPKTAIMLKKVDDFDVIVTRNEVEALLVESNFIKQYRPPYNVVLRDDKQYVFVKVTIGETWPRVFTTRTTTDASARYFGPYTSVGKLRASLKILRRAFPWCDLAATLKDPTTNRRPCFNYRIGLCPGACVGKCLPEVYGRNIESLMRYLEGHTATMKQKFERQMKEAAAAHEFEKAAQARDRLDSLTALEHSQQAIDARGQDSDVVGLARDESQAVVVLMTVRQGKVVARKEFTFWGTGGADDEAILDSFLGQYYKVATDLPREVLMPAAVPNARLVEAYLTERQGRKVTVTAPQRGARRKLLGLAEQNAAEHLRQLRKEWLEDRQRTDQALTDLQHKLDLPKPPRRIECYDISNLTGTATVASMVVFIDGTAEKAHYRRFQIKHVKGIDDFASMREVLRRRFQRRGATSSSQGQSPTTRQSSLNTTPATQSSSTGADDDSFEALPDLIIIDGGKGQVSAAHEALQQLLLDDRPLIGLAKREEEVIRLQLDGEFTSQLLPRASQGLYLLQRIRDEAHRFAISYNRNLRSKQGFRSALDTIPGIGPVKKKALMRTFGTVRGIREADIVEIQAVVGQAAGQVVKENL